MRLLMLLALVIATLALPAGSLAATTQSHDGTATAAAKQKSSKKLAKKRSKTMAARRKAARRRAARRRAAASKPKAKRRSCRRGYVLKTVRVKRRGKLARVKRCRKRKAATKPPVIAPRAPGAPAPGAALPPGASKPLFDPPGKTLEGAAAEAYVARYLHDSRFVDCPSTDPGCQSERRYSFSLAGPLWDFDFHACQLPGPGGSGQLAFFYETGIVRPDGAWSFNGTVALGGLPSFYDWSVATDGTATGLYKPFGGMPVEIGPLRYATGARGCSA